MSSRAALVPRGPVPPVLRRVGGILQRACACGNHSAAGADCVDCRRKKQSLQRAPLSPMGGTNEATSHAPSLVHEVLRLPGQPLDPATRAFMEPRFGHDLSQVRVHIGAKAAESARAVNALAYSVGTSVVFGAGR